MRMSTLRHGGAGTGGVSSTSRFDFRSLDAAASRPQIERSDYDLTEFGEAGLIPRTKRRIVVV